MSEIWERPVRGAPAPPAAYGLSGLDGMRLHLQSRVEPPPIRYWCGLEPTDAGPGTATFRMPMTPWLHTYAGMSWGGVLAIVADAALGCAVLTTQPPGTPTTTSELALSVLRPMPMSGSVSARASLVHGRRLTGLSTAEVLDDRGRLIAYGTSRCAVLPTLDVPPVALEEFPVLPPETFDGPYLYDEPVDAEPMGQDMYDRYSGLELAEMVLAGKVAASPVERLLGARLVDVAEGRTTYTLPAHAWLTQPAGVVEGGVTACFADFAMVSAVATTCGPRTAWAPVDLRMVFLRPIPPDGRLITAEASVLHRSRTMAYAQATLTNEDGKAVALAWNTCLIVPGSWEEVVGLAAAAGE